MFDAPFELADVLSRLRRADVALHEFVAPVWPGVRGAVAWVEGRAKLYALEAVPETPAYVVCVLTDAGAHVDRPATPEEAALFCCKLPQLAVVLLADSLAYPAGLAERLQGVTAPRPIWFAPEAPLAPATARFDGVNLFYDAPRNPPTRSGRDLPSLFATDDLFGPPKRAGEDEEARAILETLQADPALGTTARLQAILEAAGAACVHWERGAAGIEIVWRRGLERVTATLRTIASPLTSGICLAQPTPLNAPCLAQLLQAHLLDYWRPEANSR
jgi:hypothetical protein